MAGPWERYQSDAPAEGPWAKYAPAESERRTPKQMKIGAEGFSQAFEEEFKSRPAWDRSLAAAASFPRQMYEGAKQMLGREDKPAIEATRVMQEQEPVSAVVGGAASMVPLSRIPGINTVAGSAALGAATGALTPTQGDESRLKNTALGGLIGGGAQKAMNMASIPLSRIFKGAEEQAMSRASQQSVRDATIKEAQATGYVLPPTVTGGGVTAKAVESLGGKAAIGQEASIRNQQVTNKIARAEAGLKADEPISEGTLAAARERLAEPYREIANVSPKASKALEDLKSARIDAKNHWQFFNRNGDPKILKQAQALDAKADKLEGVIENEAAKLANPKQFKSGAARAAQEASGVQQGRDLVARLQDARKALAKNFDVEKALNVGTGDVDAKAIGRMLDKRGEKAVTGGLQTIGKFAQAFPTFAREAPTGQSGPGVSKLTPYAAAALGLGGYSASEHYGLGPWGGAAALLPMLSGPARSVALSKMMQSAPEYAPGMALRLTNQAAGSKLLPLGAIPLSNVANQN